MKRIDQLTTTRFIGMLTVIFSHGLANLYIAPIDFFPLHTILFAGPASVGYLYVLSGFVMAYVYYRPQEPFNVRGYWSSRFIRVYPMYFLSFLMTCLYYYDFMLRIKAPKILANIFLWQAWIPKYSQSFNIAAWSLSVEGFFYFIFPFFVIWAYRQPIRRLIKFSMALWVVSQIIHYVLWTLYWPDWNDFLVYFPLFHLNSFVLGVVGGIWFVSEAPKHTWNSRTNSLVLGGAMALLLLFLYLGDLYPAQVPHWQQPMEGMIAPLLLVTILALASDTTRLSKFMSHKWLVVLGETSYALYIFQLPVRWLYERFLGSLGLSNPERVFDITFLPLFLGFALLICLYVDQPLRNGLRKIVKNVSMPLLLLDLGALALSIYLSFIFRFGTGKEFRFYAPMAYAMFWAAFLVRIAASVILRSVDPAILRLPLGQAFRRVLFATSVGSVVIGLLMFIYYSIGWFENFPRSIVLLDWGFMLIASSLIRLAMRRQELPKVSPAPADAA